MATVSCILRFRIIEAKWQLHISSRIEWKKKEKHFNHLFHHAILDTIDVCLKAIMLSKILGN